MTKYCSDCAKLNLKKKKSEGIYLCNKLKKDTLTCTLACEAFEKNNLSAYEQQKLFNDGKIAKKQVDNERVSKDIVLLTILVVAGVIVWIINLLKG